MLNGGDQSKVESVYSSLRALLLDYRLRPGLHLQIAVISDELKVSVTQVREALARLWAEKLIDNIPNRGYYVKLIDPVEQAQIHEAKTEILHLALNALPRGGYETGFQELEHADSLPDKLQAIYVCTCNLTGNNEFHSMIQSRCARSHFLRKLDCEINETENKEFVAEMPELLMNGRKHDAKQLLKTHRLRLRREMPELLKEAAGRASLQSISSYALGNSIKKSEHSFEWARQ